MCVSGSPTSSIEGIHAFVVSQSCCTGHRMFSSDAGYP